MPIIKWIASDGSEYVIDAVDMEDAKQQIAVLRKQLGYPEPVYQIAIKSPEIDMEIPSDMVDFDKLTSEQQEELEELILEQHLGKTIDPKDLN